MPKKDYTPKTRLELKSEYKLTAKYAEEALIPCEAIDRDYEALRPMSNDDRLAMQNAVFVTTDNIRVRLKFIMCSHCDCESEKRFISTITDEKYSVDYERYMSIWRSRFDYLSGYWHLVQMTKI